MLGGEIECAPVNGHGLPRPDILVNLHRLFRIQVEIPHVSPRGVGPDGNDGEIESVETLTDGLELMFVVARISTKPDGEIRPADHPGC